MDKKRCIDDPRTADFHTIVYDYYEKYGRSFPWRETTDPYRILVSEVMLQQTQAPRALLKYENFIDLFPDIFTLADASLHEVLDAWQGLGYNRRALALKESAKLIVTRHGGVVPRDEESLISLPGIGPSTAGGILAFAFNEPVILIETNIRAVFIHHFFLPQENPVADCELLPLIENTLDTSNPRRWYNALMDYGTFLKKAHKNPARRSAHHTIQSPFEGSIRQMRGAILRLLLERVQLRESEILHNLCRDMDLVGKILTQLEREKIIVRNGGTVMIA